MVGYPPDDPATSNEQPLEDFDVNLNYLLVIVGPEQNHFMLNQAAQSWLDDLKLPEDS